MTIEELSNDANIGRTLRDSAEADGLKLKSRILCNEVVCMDIINRYDQNRFENMTNELLNEYYLHFAINTDASESEKALVFSVESESSEPQVLGVDESTTSSTWIYYVIGAGSLMICILLILGIRYYKLKLEKKEGQNKIDGKTIKIKRAMVIPISIGFYDKDPKPKDREFNGNVSDLDGVRSDIQHCIDLFGPKGLNYHIYPYYFHQNKDSYKAHWTKFEILSFLQDCANELEDNLKDNEHIQYDGLIVAISCHGITKGKECIITSDYKLISKEEIHRTFGRYPTTRKIPRIFLFDCCAGGKDRDTDWRAVTYNGDEESSSSEEEDEAGKGGILRQSTRERKKKQTATDSIPKDNQQMGPNREAGKGTANQSKLQLVPTSSDNHEEPMHLNVSDATKGSAANHDPEDSAQWHLGEENPDYQLLQINAANPGFQSKMSCETGSYTIEQLVNKLRENIFDNHNDKFVGDILKEIQKNLHDTGKQLLTYTPNNGTEFVKFERNDCQTYNYPHNYNKILPGNIAKASRTELISVLKKYFFANGNEDQQKSYQLIQDIIDDDRDALKSALKKYLMDDDKEILNKPDDTKNIGSQHEEKEEEDPEKDKDQIIGAEAKDIEGTGYNTTDENTALEYLFDGTEQDANPSPAYDDNLETEMTQFPKVGGNGKDNQTQDSRLSKGIIDSSPEPEVSVRL